MGLLRDDATDEARAQLDRFREAGGAVPNEPTERALLAALLESGSFLPGLLLADVSAFPRLCADPYLRATRPAEDVRDQISRALAGVSDFADVQRVLRHARRYEMLRLGARELGWGTTLEVAFELASLADACVAAAYTFAEDHVARRHGAPRADEGEGVPAGVVFAMGKHGGQELNFSSDVDLVYLYATDAGEAGARSLHAHYADVFRLVTRALDEVTDDGFVFRVDLRLRPEGSAGPIAYSLPAAERYYETFGRTWERQAWLRARPAGGSQALGAEALAMLEGFVFPRSLDAKAVDDVRALRALYRARAGAGAGGGFDVKLGAGGIRDVELVVQTLQLLHAGRRPDLRERTTVPALARLRLAGLITDREERALREAYRFWRAVEHRVQLRDGTQTHRLPADDGERARLARGLGLASLDAFDRAVGRHRAVVEQIAATFDDEAAPSPVTLRALDAAAPRQRVVTDLAALGFRQPESAADDVAMARGRIGPEVLSEAAASPHPDRALRRFRDLALHGSLGLSELLRAEPRLLRVLATLFGTSEHLSERLLARPGLWDAVAGGLGVPERTWAETQSAIAENLSEAGDEEEIGLQLRRAAAAELLRIGMNDVAGALGPRAVGRQLAWLAEACVVRALRAAWATLAARTPAPDQALHLVAMGSLGAREMRYGSDLDLVFLYEGRGRDAQDDGAAAAWFGRLAQRLIGGLAALTEEGRLYEVDTRLRPSGAQGMLVTSVDAFARYHEAHAAGWERVALVRARPLGEAGACAAVTAALTAAVYERPADMGPLASEMRRMRAKMEAERGSGGAAGGGRRVAGGARRHLRVDPGGLADVETLVALRQIAHGRVDAGLRGTSVAEALDALVARGLIKDGPALVRDRDLLETVVLRGRLIDQRIGDAFGATEVADVARTLGREPEALDRELTESMARVRAVFEDEMSRWGAA